MHGLSRYSGLQQHLSHVQGTPAGRAECRLPDISTETISGQVQVCTGCHGADGLSADPAYPVLAGQHASFLEQALQSYRSGARQNAIMGGFAAGLSDDDIKAMAAWYASMNGLTELSKK